MDTPQLGPITERFADRSTSKGFAFSFFCDQCGREWRSTPRIFDVGTAASRVEIRIFRMLWHGQHEAAYEQANLEALRAFHHCPGCGRRVCADCFCPSETEVSEVCKSCLSKNEEEKL